MTHRDRAIAAARDLIGICGRRFQRDTSWYPSKCSAAAAIPGMRDNVCCRVSTQFQPILQRLVAGKIASYINDSFAPGLSLSFMNPHAVGHKQASRVMALWFASTMQCAGVARGAMPAPARFLTISPWDKLLQLAFSPWDKEETEVVTIFSSYQRSTSLSSQLSSRPSVLAARILFRRAANSTTSKD